MDTKEKKIYERLLENKLFVTSLFLLAAISGSSIGYQIGYDSIETPIVAKQELQFNENFSPIPQVAK